MLKIANFLKLKKQLCGRHHGLNFINVLGTASTCADPRSVKKTVEFSIFFTPSGSTCLNDVRKTLVKLTPGLAVT